jgi:hypothetical protein
MSEIANHLAEVAGNLSKACSRTGRDAAAVELIAISKTFPADSVREAVLAGQLHFGESKLQEAESKISSLPGNLHWHFIGRIQRNKVRKLLQHFEFLHGIDSLRLAAFTNDIAKETGLYPKVFLQVNVGGEASKGGFEPEELRAEIPQLLALDRLEIMGLMSIPPAGPSAEAARPWFVTLRELRDTLQREFDVALPALSMGMSSDYEVAAEEGATHVRVGSAIFGKRAYRVDGELG